MKVVVLGSGTHIADPERGSPGFLLLEGDVSILIDGGSGTLQRVAAAGQDPVKLSGGVYTHRHLDHCGDLQSILFSMRVSMIPRSEPYPIWAGSGFQEYLSGLDKLYGDWIMPDKVDLTELSLTGPDKALLPGGILLETQPANHTQGALHLRFTSPSGKKAVFSGDTGPSPALNELAQGADLLVCECAMIEGDTFTMHMQPSQVEQLLRESRPSQAAIHHLYPRANPAKDLGRIARSGVPVCRAYDGQVFEL